MPTNSLSQCDIKFLSIEMASKESQISVKMLAYFYIAHFEMNSESTPRPKIDITSKLAR